MTESSTLKKKSKAHSQKIKKIFHSIALKYDQANKIITLGMDAGWRKKLVRWSKAPRNGKILDCATGTGVLAFEFQKQIGPEAQITAVDFCENMLEQARKVEKDIQERHKSASIRTDLIKKKADTKKASSCSTPERPSDSNAVFCTKSSSKKNICFQLADIHQLPFPDNTFDVCSIGYGLRNVEDPVKVLKEMARVTKNGGTVMILETGDKPLLILYPFFYLYFRYVMPCIGGWLTGQKSAYEYLQKSSRNFPSRYLLLKLLAEINCFGKCEYKTLFFGASFIYKVSVSHPLRKRQHPTMQ